MTRRRCITLVPLIAALLQSTHADYALRRTLDIVAVDDVESFKNEQFKRNVDNYEWVSSLKGTKSGTRTGSADSSAKAAKSASTKSSNVKSAKSATTKSSGMVAVNDVVSFKNEQFKTKVDEYEWVGNLKGSKSEKAAGSADRSAKAAKSASTKSSAVKSAKSASMKSSVVKSARAKSGGADDSKDTKTQAASKKEGSKLSSAEGDTYDRKSSKANTKNSKAETKSSKTSKAGKRSKSGKKEMGYKSSKKSKKSHDSFLDELDMDFEFGFSMPSTAPTLPPTTPAPTSSPTTPAPSTPPTPVPSAKPTPTPSTMPTADPSISPSLSISPSFAPTPVPTSMPSEPPMLTPSQICSALPREVSLLNSLAEVTNVPLLTNPFTPQGTAYLWLLDDDPSQVDPCSYETLLQRYALATFIFSTTESSPWDEATGWLSGEFECNWFNVTCAGGDLVTQIFLGKYNG